MLENDYLLFLQVSGKNFKALILCNKQIHKASCCKSALIKLVRTITN